jgi:uncharacterized protein YdaU (DUF1376 family)
MHYFQFNIGDYQSHTAHLSDIEDLAYRRLLDWYYLHESPIPLDLNEVSRQIRMRPHSDCISSVLNEYFSHTSDGWIHHRANKEIAKVGEKSEKASESAKARWNKVKDANALPTQSDSNATHNTLPITHNTIVKQNRGSRLQADFCLTDDWKEFCRKERLDLDPQKVFDGFKDYWIAKPGQQGVKLDWFATWRNWVRNQKQGLVNKADQVFTTVPSRFERDPALIDVENKLKQAVPMPPEIRAAIERLRK